jgi:hypothetical protein
VGQQQGLVIEDLLGGPVGHHRAIHEHPWMLMAT